MMDNQDDIQKQQQEQDIQENDIADDVENNEETQEPDNAATKQEQKQQDEDDVYTYLEKQGFNEEQIDILVRKEKFKLQKDYTGNPKYYKTPQQLLERYKRDQERQLQKESKIEKQLQELRQTVSSRYNEEDRVKLSEYLNNIESQMTEAVESGDIETVKKLLPKRDELLQKINSVNTPKQQQQNTYTYEQEQLAKHHGISPELMVSMFNEFSVDNDHIFKEYGAEAEQIAIGEFQNLMRTNPNLSIAGKIKHCQKSLDKFFEQKQSTKQSTPKSGVPTFVSSKPPTRTTERTVAMLNEEGKSTLEALKRNHPDDQERVVEIFMKNNKHNNEFFRK